MMHQYKHVMIVFLFLVVAHYDSLLTQVLKDCDQEQYVLIANLHITMLLVHHFWLPIAANQIVLRYFVINQTQH